MPKIPGKPAKKSNVIHQHDATERRETLGINVQDLDRFPPEFRVPLLRDRVDLSTIIRFDYNPTNNPSEVFIPFSCDLLTACKIGDIIRSEDRKLKQTPTRLYLCKNRAWKRIPPNAILCVKVGDLWDVNTEIMEPLIHFHSPLSPRKF